MAAPTTAPITTRYGVPGDWAAGYHPGEDYALRVGSTLRACADGKVISASTRCPWGSAYGTAVIVESKVNGATYRWILAHMSKTSVTAGQIIKLGQVVGLSGNTGRTTGPHTHLEVRHAPYGYWDHVNPKVIRDVKPAPVVKITPEKVVYTVTAKPELVGRAWPVNGPIKASADFGQIVTSVGYTAKQSDGNVWVKNISGYYWCKKYLTVAAPTPPPAPFTVRGGLFNCPDTAKLPNTAARVKRAGEQVKAANLSVVCGNEWVGRKTDNTASNHAKAMIASFGWADPRLVVPTTDFNENYIALDETVTKFVKQYPDKILKSTAGNRHMTIAVVKDAVTNRRFLSYALHLVNGKANGADRVYQSEQAAAELKRIAALEGGIPILGGGDMNRSDDLQAFLKIGLVRGIDDAPKKTGAGYATYTHIDKTRPSTNLEYQLDDFYLSTRWVTNGWTNVTDSPGGVFTKPRPSDHMLVIISATLK